jgi:diguanylate cyclase (GGDEF)-like protein
MDGVTPPQTRAGARRAPAAAAILPSWRKYLPLGLTLAGGITVSVAAFLLLLGASRARLMADFTSLALDRANAISAGLAEDRVEIGLLGSFFAASNELQEDKLEAFAGEFRRLVQSLPWQEEDNVLIGLVLRVAQSERGAFETRARAALDPSFAIRDFSGENATVVAGRRSEYYAVAVSEPRERSGQILGLDLLTVPEIRSTLQRAAITGHMISTGLVGLPDDSEPIIWLVRPLHGSGRAAGTLMGFAAYAFRVDTLVESALKDMSPAGIDLEIRDASAPADKSLLYYHHSRASSTWETPGRHPALSWSGPIDFGEREWTVRAYATDSFTRGRRTAEPWILLAGGFLLTAFAGLSVFERMRRTAGIERLVAERTRALRVQVSRHRRLERALQASRKSIASRAEQLDQRNREVVLLNETGDLLQSCVSSEEAFPVISLYAPRLLPGTSGALYMYDAEKRFLSVASQWGSAQPKLSVLATDDCWALRRGRVNTVTGSSSDLSCAHAPADRGAGCICIPLTSMGETIGLFHAFNLGAQARSLAVSAAEHIALALSNLRLRSDLRSLSIHDPLTELFNRRCMEEALLMELKRSERGGQPVGIVMLDIDHFKAFNDAHGHAAGDELLRAIGAFLRARLRGGDLACRYGGEEFLLILPDASREATRQRAEELRLAVKDLDVRLADRRLGPVSLSFGVAVFPEHGGTRDEILRAADAALYRAKDGGRDQVSVASTATP